MGLKINFGLQVVKWQRWQVDYLSEKSVLTIDFLPKYHWFPGQKCLQNLQGTSMAAYRYYYNVNDTMMCLPGEQKMSPCPSKTLGNHNYDRSLELLFSQFAASRSPWSASPSSPLRQAAHNWKSLGFQGFGTEIDQFEINFHYFFTTWGWN